MPERIASGLLSGHQPATRASMLMNAYSLAADLLGAVELGSEQRAQLRAIDYRYQLEVQRRLQAGDTLSADDHAALRSMLLTEILDMLTPEQRARVQRR